MTMGQDPNNNNTTTTGAGPVPFAVAIPADDPFVDTVRPRDPETAQQYALNAERFVTNNRRIIRPRQQATSPDYKAQGRQAAILGRRAAETRERQKTAQVPATEHVASRRVLGGTPDRLLSAVHRSGDPLFGTGYGQEPPRPVAHHGSAYNEPLPTMFGDLNELVPSFSVPTHPVAAARPITRHGPKDGQIDADSFRMQMNQRIEAYDGRPVARHGPNRGQLDNADALGD